MEVNILASGSSGNCIALTSDSGKTILIDAGIPKTKIEKRLLEVGIRADQIEAIFITHAHGDHIKGLPLANKYRIPVFATEGEWKGIKCVDDDLKHEVKDFISTGEITVTDELRIGAFKSHHDAYNPVGYTVWNDKCKVSVCLDTGHVDADMLRAMKDSDVYIIEANHVVERVEQCNRPQSIINRILSDIGHLSNEQTAAALQKLVKGNGERIYLTHLSGENNTKDAASQAVRLALFEKNLINNKHYYLEVL
ncbi:MBL fold metallo-hydrolase [Paenibacillus anaericanus]|uniref:MBL fold metallo-hydrolase n=1 Tax=Paenibacillus anaericanus TaxID=170367 RepID=A0A3S1KC13_9BACL|nr:MBL fold metallo-hydrolase [Paenibacillus anaericanus]RUT48562.1 MBL fold metallo-hydrolase [Paenibacillus anaericanus]